MTAIPAVSLGRKVERTRRKDGPARLPHRTSTTPAHGREAIPMARAAGIDPGTTNSVVTARGGREPTVIANSEGSRTTPSVVAFAKNGELVVGQSAKNQAV